jgi:hypothetical protein
MGHMLATDAGEEDIAETGVSPAKAIERLRADAARAQLASGKRPHKWRAAAALAIRNACAAASEDCLA